MSFDERMERIDTRLEALVQTVELMAHMHQDFERAQKAAHQELDEARRKNEEAHQRNEEMMEKNQVLMANVLESIDRLARIAHAHEHRISGLEDRRT
jgi:transcriptional regulator with GAF, ATPase, and Fis domain